MKTWDQRRKCCRLACAAQKRIVVLPSDDDFLVNEAPLPSLNEFEIQILVTPEMRAVFYSVVDRRKDSGMWDDACLDDDVFPVWLHARVASMHEVHNL
jgi:hypothetical protein